MNLQFLTPKLHGLLDYAAAAGPIVLPFLLGLAATTGFVAAPFAFGWGGLVLGYYVVMAAGVLVVVAPSKPHPVSAPVTDPS